MPDWLIALGIQAIPYLLSSFSGGTAASIEGEAQTAQARAQAEATIANNQQRLDLIQPFLQALQESDTNGLEASVRQAFTESDRINRLRNNSLGLGQSDFAAASNNNLFNNFLLGQAQVVNQDRFNRQSAAGNLALNALPNPYLDPSSLTFTQTDANNQFNLGALGALTSAVGSDTFGFTSGLANAAYGSGLIDYSTFGLLTNAPNSNKGNAGGA